MRGDQVRMIGTPEAGPRGLVGLTVTDSRFHVHVPGVTGTGKSTLLANLALQDAQAGRGVVAVDPKGDMVSDLLARLPASGADRLVLIDPAETYAPVAFNVFDGPDPELTADQLVAIFRRVFAAWWGPRMDDILRCACLTLMRAPAPTLADVPRILTDRQARAPLVAAVRGEPFLRSFWDWYESLSEAGQATAAGPVLSKLRAVLVRRFVTDLLGSGRSTFDMRTVLDGGVLLARLPKGLLGEDTARLVGSLIVAKVWQTVLARARVPEARRRDASLVLDEFHNFLHLPGALEDILAEARGYRLSVVLAHQHMEQLPRGVAAAVSANARNKICFTLEPGDAREMAHHLGPVLTEADLARLGRFQVACRLLADGVETGGFTLRTTPLPPADRDREVMLRAACRTNFGRDRDQRRADELRARRHLHRLHPGTGKPRASAGVSAGVSVGASAGVLGDANGDAATARLKSQVSGDADRGDWCPDSWGKP